MAQVPPSAELIPIPGYLCMRRLPDGRVIGIAPQIYTIGLMVDIDTVSYAYRYCYEHTIDALLAYQEWDGQGDPPGPWLKLKGDRNRPDEHGPGWAGFVTRKAPG